MMQNCFLCKIKYEKTMENGQNKKVTEIMDVYPYKAEPEFPED